MRTIKDELSAMFREYLPAYPGSELLADKAVQIFMDWLVEKLPESVACAYKAFLGGIDGQGNNQDNQTQL